MNPSQQEMQMQQLGRANYVNQLHANNAYDIHNQQNQQLMNQVENQEVQGNQQF